MRFALPCLLVTACGWLEPSPEAISYTVVRGDTLGEIAAAHGVGVDELRAWNSLEGDLIEVGQVLAIHGSTGPEASVARPSARSPRRAPAARAPSETRARSMPAPKPCLAPPDITGDDAMSASTGLDRAQIRSAVDGWLPEVLSCVDEVPAGTAQLSFRVGCDGRVRSVSIAADWPPALSDCVTDTFRYAPFPAHQLPDGDTFTIPLSFGP